jgi:hypothetical protein
MTKRTVLATVLCLFAASNSQAQSPPSSPAPSAIWNALVAGAPDPTQIARTENVDIVRDKAHITLVDGTLQLIQPANGRVYGAAFRGNGHLQIDIPNSIEGQQLRLLAKMDKIDLAFTEATFTFSDDFVAEVSKQVKWRPEGTALGDLYEKRQRERESLGESSVPRIFQSVMSEDRARTAFFLADLKTKDRGWVEVRQDALQPEDFSVGHWSDTFHGIHFDIWMSFPTGGVTAAKVWQDPQAKEDFAIRSNTLNVTVTSGAELHATSTMEIDPRFSGQRVLLFDLDSNLRVESIKDAQGNAIDYAQSREDKDRRLSYGNYLAVILPSPLKQGTLLSLTFTYGGKRAIRKAGDGNFFCESSGWYPDRPNSFSTRTNFDLTFHSPKNTLLVATGGKTSETVDGNTRITTWKSEIPLAVAGFAYGDYKVSSETADKVGVDVYANRQPDDVMTMMQRYFDSGRAMAAVGVLTPTAMAKTMGVEMSNMIRLFDSFYGPYPYSHLAVTSMPISYSYGQGWPGLIYLWSASFLDVTQRHAIGLKDPIEVTDFFRAHETSHQWWGHRVGWKSYHDQWLSEGFAEFSGNLYVEYRENEKDYLERWRKEKEHLKMKDTFGHEIDSLGPIWMGERILSSQTDGGSYQNLIYSKGGYVLQMLRFQLQNPLEPDPDRVFKEMMQDYCKTFDNKPASTEDFKAIVEKHMLRGMDLDGNKKMDWFFNQYVYGTGIPQYNLHVTAEASPDGKTHIKGQLTRTGVPDSWKDVVPIYAHIGNKMVRMGSLAATHQNEPIDVMVGGKIDRVSINEHEEMLADVHQ